MGTAEATSEEGLVVLLDIMDAIMGSTPSPPPNSFKHKPHKSTPKNFLFVFCMFVYSLVNRFWTRSGEMEKMKCKLFAFIIFSVIKYELLKIKQLF